ncbi:hypothetical protein [Zunongwangia sp. HRR-M8]|uniref:hypothetical protein n=1 Tax=Zunongwangia sp. HRR-M8 TaxID=3015170 RepID=UPI0022DD4980|nr:hypothetical protein [Zunongwangia sp. HRR-M8]WBL22844.1 hypothetical protein PBT89_02525 [Zunongwangia sp. HRR-M8]
MYIHLNPYHHGFTSSFEKYKHSSFYAMISNGKTLLMRDDVLELFDDKSNFRFMHYKRQNEICEKKSELYLE